MLSVSLASWSEGAIASQLQGSLKICKLLLAGLAVQGHGKALFTQRGEPAETWNGLTHWSRPSSRLLLCCLQTAFCGGVLLA